MGRKYQNNELIITKAAVAVWNLETQNLSFGIFDKENITKFLDALFNQKKG